MTRIFFRASYLKIRSGATVWRYEFGEKDVGNDFANNLQLIKKSAHCQLRCN